MKYFSSNLKHLLKTRGIKNSVLAEILGWTEGALSSYVTGRVVPKLDQVDSIAQYLGVSIDDLVYKNLKDSSYTQTSTPSMLRDSGDEEKEILIRSLIDRVKKLENQLESEEGKEALEKAISDLEIKRRGK